MRDIYPQVREVFAALLRCIGFDVTQADISCRSPYSEVSAAIFARGAGESQPDTRVLEGIHTIGGHPWVRCAELRSGYVCLSLCESFYLQQIQHMLYAYPQLPPALEDVALPAQYAYMRARMYARGHGMCLEDDALRRTLWLCMGLRESGLSARARAARLREATEAVLKLGKGLPPAQRQAYFETRGEVLRAIAWLLYEGIQTQGDEINGN